MKKIFSIISVISFLIILNASCKKDDDSNTVDNLNSNIVQGEWKITFFEENGSNETNHFTGYEFKFNSDGSVIATKSFSAISGTWSTGGDDSQVKLNLDFEAISNFEDLNDDWDVYEQSTTVIKLEDVSGGNGGIDYLSFEKI